MPHSLPAIIAHVRQQNRPASYGGMLLAEIDRLTALVEDMAGPTVAWAQACARQAELPPGTFRPHHQDLIDRINAALKETTDV